MNREQYIEYINMMLAIADERTIRNAYFFINGMVTTAQTNNDDSRKQ